MRNTSLFNLSLAIWVLATNPLIGQELTDTRTSVPPDETSQRLFADSLKLEQRNAQILAETEAAVQTNASFITSGDGSKCRKTVELLVQQRSLVIRSLTTVIESTNSWQAKDAAATVLGNYRAQEAISCLVSNIQQDTTFKLFAGLVTEDYRKPFGAALADIGEPAVPALLNRISVEDSDRVADRCLEVIVRIVGRERAAELLRVRIEDTTDSKLKGRFKRVLSKVQT